MLDPNKKAESKDHALEPKGRIDGVGDDDHRHQRKDSRMMNGANNAAFFRVVGFPEEDAMNNPLSPVGCGLLHCFKEDGGIRNMQPARELTPQEVEEGRRGIRDDHLTATQIQALVKTMDASKTKWKQLKRQGKLVEYEAKLKSENETLYFNYPSLFQLHLEDRLDATFFEMLQLKRKIERGEMTAEQASTLVGQTLYNRFVPHVLSNQAPPAPKMSYADYCRQMGQE